MGRSQLPGPLEEREPRFAKGRITASSRVARLPGLDTTFRQLKRRVHPDDFPFLSSLLIIFLCPFPKRSFVA